MKRLSILLLSLLCTAATTFAYDFQSGDLYYNITSDTTVEVTYQKYWQEIWNSANYQGLTTATIPETVTYNGTTYSVTSIGDYTFDNCFSLTSVTIPNSVTNIGMSAFYGCSALTSITIPNFVTSIGNNAFSGCSALTSITIPNSVTSIGNNAFSGCSSFTSITIPNSVTSIGNYAFISCESLTSMMVESGNTVYDTRENCNAIIETASKTLIAGCQSTTIPNSVTSIGGSAFYGCSSLTSLTIPNSVTSIGSSAFSDCSSLTSITIPNSVTSIGSSAFSDCSSLTSITIPNSVTTVGDYAFYKCSSLTSITIPNSVTTVGDYAFYKCSSLTSITIPNSITSIGWRAFLACSSLTQITCLAQTPPTCGDDCFYGVPRTIPLYVPDEAVEDYKAAAVWQEFNIVAESDAPTAIENARSTDTHGVQKILRDGQVLILRNGETYDMMGQRL